MALETNLISNWSFEGDSNDNKGSNDGTDTSITYGASYGKISKGASFNGASPSYIKLPANIRNSFPMSFNTWFYRSGTDDGALFSNMVGAPYLVGPLFRFAIVESAGVKKIGMYCRTSGYSDNTYESAEVTIPAGWNMVTFTVETGSNNVKFYLNGSSIYTGTLSSSDYFNSQVWIIGAWYDSGYNQKYTGYLDEMSLWSSILSTTYISSLYNNGAGLYFNGTNFVKNNLSNFLQFF